MLSIDIISRNKVYAGTFNTKPVAVKKFIINEGNEEEFENEVKLVGYDRLAVAANTTVVSLLL